MQVVEQIKGASEVTTGAVLAGLGTVGTTVQIITLWGNMFVAIGNVLMLLAGAYLMMHKLKERRRRNRRKTDKEEDDLG